MGTLLSQKQFENNSTMQKEDVMTILVTLKSIAIPTPRSKPTLNLLHRVITARDVSTTRFILFRKRTSSSSLKCPSIFHTNFQDLSSHHKHFEGLLDAKAVLEGFELPKDGCLKDYTLLSEHQDSDSNFEQSEGGDEEEEDSAVLMNGLPCHDEVAAVQERKKRSDPTTVHRPTSVVHIKMDIDVSPSSTNDPSDVAIIEDLQTHRNDVRPLEPTQRSFCSVLPPAHGRHCYTGCIEFAPLSGEDRQAREDFVIAYRSTNSNRPTPPSCKSIYALAHKIALRHLQWQLSPHTVLREIFSKFTFRYEEVKEMELAIIVKYWDKIKSSAAFKEKMTEVISGKMPHAGVVISEIMLRVSVK